MHVGASTVLALALALPLPAQFSSRAEEIQAARERKARTLQPDVLAKPERTLLNLKDNKVLERLSAGVGGFRLKLGGLVTGGGFALGPEYLRRDIRDGSFFFRASAQASTRRYQQLEIELGSPGLVRNRLYFDLFAARHDYPAMNYYGPGPDSDKGGRSSFRREGLEFESLVGVRVLPRLSWGVSTAYLTFNTGPGSDRRLISTEQAFTPDRVPGLDHQTDFIRAATFVRYDSRDNPGGPRSGGLYLAQLSSYSDRTLKLHDFQRLDIELQQYLPLFNKRRVFALRGKTAITLNDRPGSVPFYLQPVLGGSDDLRGFRPFRFYDRNLIVLNGEYRWEAFSGLDMALFVDGGKVFAHRSNWNFRNLEGSAGFGLRFNIRNSTFLRTDVGFSHEGFQVWIKFNDVFGGGSGTAASPRVR